MHTASIGINRNDFLAVIQMRPQMEQENGVIEWLAFASNAFNVLVPFYADVEETPEYLSNTTGEVSTENFYWSSRLIAAMADASYRSSVFHIERYQEHVMAKGHELIHHYDELLAKETDAVDAQKTSRGRQTAALRRCCRRRRQIPWTRFYLNSAVR